MADRRRFNQRERAVLWLASGGRCQQCGCLLDPENWHADHIYPRSRGGATDVLNGRATCPPCNLRKGNRVYDDALRDWQEDAAEKFLTSCKKDFLLCATPGAGKTRLALYLARQALRDGTVERVAVVVPTDTLRQQWAEEAALYGLDLMPVSVAADYAKRGYAGCVVTYQQLATGAGADLMRQSLQVSTFVILDEVHHAGKDRSWGTSLRYAVDPAVRRLALTGTPWRHDPNSPIPYAVYGPDDKVVTDSSYEYGAAVADGVCRRIEFHAYDGDARWIDHGRIIQAALGNDLDEGDTRAALAAVLDPEHNWMPGVLREACVSLDELRPEVPDAGGLVVASTQKMAIAYAAELERLTGEAPIVAISDDAEAQDKIVQFRDGRQRWLVAVKMVSEGVDIKRLAVGVYASKALTPLFFRQVVGRFVRTRPGEEINARLYIPAITALTNLAREVEEELRHQLEVERERDGERIPGDGQRTFEMREILSASEPAFSSSIYAGSEIAPELYRQAEQWCRDRGIPAMYAANVVDEVQAASRPTVKVTVTPEPAARSRLKREKLLRSEIKELVNRLSASRGMEPKEINQRLLRPTKFGGAGLPPRARASVEDLERTSEALARWLGQV